MSKPYAEVCDAERFLNPDNFGTPYDVNPERKRFQYAEGLRIGQTAELIYIDVHGVWGARMKNGASLQSYERIGYHAHTADLLRGFLDSGCEIYVYRWGKESKQIK